MTHEENKNKAEGILLKANSVDAKGISYTPEALKKAVEDFRKECAVRGKQKEAQGAIIINHKTGGFRSYV